MFAVAVCDWPRGKNSTHGHELLQTVGLYWKPSSLLANDIASIQYLHAVGVYAWLPYAKIRETGTILQKGQCTVLYNRHQCCCFFLFMHCWGVMDETGGPSGSNIYESNDYLVTHCDQGICVVYIIPFFLTIRHKTKEIIYTCNQSFIL